MASGDEFRLDAVIDVGSTSIRMMIAQIDDDGTVHRLEDLSQSVAIGRDTFTKGRIARTTVEDCAKVLRSFSALLNEYGIDLRKNVRAVATSAVREARNRDEFLDRIYMATGINVEVIEGTDVNRLTFLAIRSLLEAHEELRNGYLMVAEAGGGNTEILGLHNGRVAFAHTYRLGAYRLHETMYALHSSAARQVAVLEMEVDTALRQIQGEVGQDGAKGALLLLGGDARFAAKCIKADWDEQRLVQLKIHDLKKFTHHVLHSSEEQLSKEYNLSLEDAQTLGPAMQIYMHMAKEFSLKKVYVCGVSLRAGLLVEAAGGNVWTEDFVEQILFSARELGRHYQLDEDHANVVTDLAQRLYRTMASEHKLSQRHEVMFQVAAYLHDIGSFVSTSGHHKHSQYIIEHSEIFGLGDEDMRLLALVARYHRRATPKASHENYDALSRENRLVLVKLASLLRIADALDHSHRGVAKHVRFELQGQTLVIHAGREVDLAVEKRVLAEKSKMFEQVYGCEIKLQS